MWRAILGLFLVVTLAPAASAQTGKHVAIGAGLTYHKYVDDNFSQKNPGISFIYRIDLKPDGHKDGWKWEPKGGFGWFLADTAQDVAGLATHVGKVRARPFMGGIERSYRQGPLQAGLSAVVGPSFNHFNVDDVSRAVYRTRLGRELNDITVKTSIAVRPEVSVWYDLGPWLALHSSVSYMINRPTAEMTIGGTTTSTRWNTDHANFQIGLVVGIF
jgi:hypothetical protein